MTDPLERPAAAPPYDLPPKLAEMLVRGWLSATAAEAALSLAAEQTAIRQGHDSAWAAWLHGVLRHLMMRHAEMAQTRRQLAAHRIRRTVKVLADRRTPSNQLLAEAHNVNEDHDYPLDEAEVQIEAADIVRRALPRRPRHG